MTYCKYRDCQFRRCRHGCTADVTVCHKWSKKECRYQCQLRCRYGVHYHPTNPPPSGQNRPWAKAQPQLGGSSSSGQTEAEIEADVAAKSLLQMLTKEPRADEHLRRLLLVFHPDKVKDTSFESVFTKVTQKINALRAAQ